MSVTEESAILPASALTPPDALARRRRVAPLLWSLNLTLTILGMWWLVAVILDDARSHSLEFLWVALVTSLQLLVLLIFTWSERVGARNARLAISHPDALRVVVFFGVYDAIAAATMLRRELAVERPRFGIGMPLLTTLVVDERGIGFWVGSVFPREAYHLPWNRVGPVIARTNLLDNYPASSWQYLAHIGVVPAAEHEGGLYYWLRFMAWRSNMWHMIGYRSSTVTDAFVSAIDARRPVAPEAAEPPSKPH